MDQSSATTFGPEKNQKAPDPNGGGSWPELVSTMNPQFSYMGVNDNLVMVGGQNSSCTQSPNFMVNPNCQQLIGMSQNNYMNPNNLILNRQCSTVDLVSGVNSPSGFSDTFSFYLQNTAAGNCPEMNGEFNNYAAASQNTFVLNETGAIVNTSGSPGGGLVGAIPPSVSSNALPRAFVPMNSHPSQLAALLSSAAAMIVSDKQNEVAQGVFVMYQLAKNESTRPVIFQNPSIIPLMVQAFNDHVSNGSILRCCSAFIYYTSLNKKDVLLMLYQAGVMNVFDKLWETGVEAVFYYTISAFHSIFLNVPESRDYFTDLSHLIRFIKLLGHKNDKFVAIVTDCLCVCSKNFDASFVMQSTEISNLLLDILRNRTYEKLLYNVCRLLKELTSTNQSKMILIKKEALHTFTTLLLHVSRRVAVTALFTIRNLSDVSNKEVHMEELLNILLRFIMNQLDATTQEKANSSTTPKNQHQFELQLVSSSIGILANLTCNNASNKVFLVEKGAIAVLVNVCKVINTKEIIESTISTLRHVTCRHEKSVPACEQFVKLHGLEVLTTILSKCAQEPLESCSNLKKVSIGLLVNIANRREFLPMLRDLKVTQMAAHTLAAAVEEVKKSTPSSLPKGMKPATWKMHIYNCEKLLEVCSILLHLMTYDELSLQLMTSSSILITLFSKLLATANGAIVVYAISFLNEISYTVQGLQNIENAFIFAHQTEAACTSAASRTGNVCIARLLEASFKAIPSSKFSKTLDSFLQRLSTTSLANGIVNNSLYSEKQDLGADLALQSYLNGDFNVFDSPSLTFSPDTSRIYDRL